MERIAIVAAIVALLFLLGRLGAKISSKHPDNENNDAASGIGDQRTDE